MARETEPAFNARFAELLGRRHPLWEGVLGSERTGVLRDGALRPDVVVLHPGGLPVVVETEFEPARTVERDAIARLGAILAQSGSLVEQTLALRIPVQMTRTAWWKTSLVKSSQWAPSSERSSNR